MVNKSIGLMKAYLMPNVLPSKFSTAIFTTKFSIYVPSVFDFFYENEYGVCYY